NSGSYAPGKVTVTSTGGTPLCFTNRNLDSLPVGGVTNIYCTNLCPVGVLITNNFAVTVTAVASQAAGHICAYTSNGVPVTASSSCDTCVACTGCPRINVTKGIACVVCTSNETGISLECASFNGQFNHD